jgi:beta-phosphoglucomutase-like phosphatase (HAD superfamily)
MYRVVLFDLDGTLAETDSLRLPTWVDVLEPYGVEGGVLQARPCCQRVRVETCRGASRTARFHRVASKNDRNLRAYSGCS